MEDVIEGFYKEHHALPRGDYAKRGKQVFLDTKAIFSIAMQRYSKEVEYLTFVGTKLSHQVLKEYSQKVAADPKLNGEE